MQDGIADAMKNGHIVGRSVQSMQLAPQDQARFGDELRGLLVSSYFCTGFLPSEHLRIFNRLREMGVSFEVCMSTPVPRTWNDLYKRIERASHTTTVFVEYVPEYP